jgi:hypothetical protein
MIGGSVDTKRQNEGKSKTTYKKQIKGQKKKTRDKKTK